MLRFSNDVKVVSRPPPPITQPIIVHVGQFPSFEALGFVFVNSSLNKGHCPFYTNIYIYILPIEVRV